MAIFFKCKMCGGTLEIGEKQTVAVCEYCGTKQTIPRFGDEDSYNLFNRANNLRIRNEFDKAAELYEKLIRKGLQDSEAYWGLVLCRFGIEYIEDAQTDKRIPTCHRTQLESVLSDVDYKLAVQYADDAQKAVYEQEAREIDLLQKDVLNIVANEEPFDVFICCKETDAEGKRTTDSVIANDIYHQLTTEGFKVFYAAITLEDKLGKEYEPYIFSALNTAKVLLAIGTRPEYFNAVWVKNEWSRFLKFVRQDRSKLLIPCYKDMDPYDLPEEFAHLQAQDMSKIGFISDVIRGVKKVVGREEIEKAVPTHSSSNLRDAQNTLNHGYLLLEDGEWEKAKELFDFAIMNNDNKARAYIGRLLAKLKLSNLESLASVNKKLIKFDDFNRAVKYADDNYKQQLRKYYSLVEEKINQKKAKVEKRILISSIVGASMVVLFAITYFVFIPLGRYSYYENLLSNGKITEAIQLFSESEWFEYNGKVKELFYNTGVSLVENKDYINAEFCFDITKDFKDSKKYATYCKAQNLLAENDLESYNYFTECEDFLDSRNILETNKYFIIVNKLQGQWYYPGVSAREVQLKKEEWRKSGKYYEVDGIFFLKQNYDSYQQLLEEIQPTPGTLVSPTYMAAVRINEIEFAITASEQITIFGTDQLRISGNSVSISYNNYFSEVEFIDDKTITIIDKETIITKKFTKQ